MIWGDNRLVLSSLKNGPLRRHIEEARGVKLVYIDPPFDIGTDFSFDVEIGEESEESLTKEASAIEGLAYRDTWGRGQDSYLAMIFERLRLIHGLLLPEGTIYVHCDWRLNSALRLVLDDIFGPDNFMNELVWKRDSAAKG